MKALGGRAVAGGFRTGGAGGIWAMRRRSATAAAAAMSASRRFSAACAAALLVGTGAGRVRGERASVRTRGEAKGEVGAATAEPGVGRVAGANGNRVGEAAGKADRGALGARGDATTDAGRGLTAEASHKGVVRPAPAPVAAACRAAASANGDTRVVGASGATAVRGGDSMAVALDNALLLA